MSRYKARHLYCSETSSNKLWDQSLTLSYHTVIRWDTKRTLGIRAQRGLLGPLVHLAPGSPWWESDPDVAVKSRQSCWTPPLGHLSASSCLGRVVLEISQSYKC